MSLPAADPMSESKEDQWMGVTVQSQGPGGKVVVSVGKGVLLRAGYGAPSSVPVTGRPPWCQLWGSLFVLVMGHPPGCRLRGALLNAVRGAPSLVPVSGHPPRCWLWAYSSGQNTEPLPRFTSENKPNLHFSREGC